MSFEPNKIVTTQQLCNKTWSLQQLIYTEFTLKNEEYTEWLYLFATMKIWFKVFFFFFIWESIVRIIERKKIEEKNEREIMSMAAFIKLEDSPMFQKQVTFLLIPFSFLCFFESFWKIAFWVLMFEEFCINFCFWN